MNKLKEKVAIINGKECKIVREGDRKIVVRTQNGALFMIDKDKVVIKEKHN